MSLHAIEQTQLRGRRRVDGVGRLRFDFHTASNSRWCRFFSSIFSYLSFRLPPAMVAAMAARDASRGRVRFDYVSWRRGRRPPRVPAARVEAAQEAALSHAREYGQRFPGFRAVRSNYLEVSRRSTSTQSSANAVAR